MEEQKIKKQRLMGKLYVFFKKPRLSFLWVGIILIIFFIFLVFIGMILEDSSSVSGDEEPIYQGCSVAGINLHGSLVTYIPEVSDGNTNYDDTTSSDYIYWSIREANREEDVKYIVVEVDSYGGLPVAGEEMANAIKNSEKPVIGFVRESALSAAYWAISGADKIWASKNSDVGSIGVTMSYLNNVEKNKKEGYTYEQLSAGKYKDSGNPDALLTKEEKDLFMRDINIIHQNFIDAVSVNRNIPIEKVRSFADGSSVLGEKAKELSLIDEIGGIYEIEKYIEEQIGEKPEICWY